MHKVSDMSELLKRWALAVFVGATSICGIVGCIYLMCCYFTSPPGLILGGVLLLLLTFNAAFNIVACYYFVRACSVPVPQLKPLKRYPSVAVIVPARNEKPEIIYKTLHALKTIEYSPEKINFYLLDNSDVPDQQVENFCKSHGVRYVYMENPMRLKSYVLNKLIAELDEEYIAIFDSDDVLHDKRFLLDNLGYLEEDPSLASVQTRKEYRPGNFFSMIVNSYYAFFYRFIQPVRHVSKSAMFCGSAGIVRRSIAAEVGFPDSPTEDTAFSFNADLKGYGGIFIPKNYVHGEPIQNFSTFVAQQWRYTIGNTWLVSAYLKNLLHIPLNKHLHYATQVFSFMYLSYPFILYAALTLTCVLCNLVAVVPSTMSEVSGVARTLSAGYTVAVVLMTLAGAKLYFGSVSMGLSVLFINFSVTIMRAKAVIVALLKLPVKFVWTRQGPERLSLQEAIDYTFLETALSLMLLSFSIVAWMQNDPISAFWLLWYAIFFSSAFLLTILTDVRPAPRLMELKEV